MADGVTDTGLASRNPLPLAQRILRFPLVKLVVLGAAMFLVLGLSNSFMVQNKSAPIMAIIAVAGMISLAFWIYVGFARLVEGRPVSDLALAAMPRELGLGVLIGTGLYTACVLILMVLGIYRIEGVNPVTFMIPAMAMALSSGFLEELLFRGVLFRIVEEWLGSWVALIVSSVLFGVMHLANPAGTLTGAIFISIEAGLLLAAAYMLTRRLWLGIGFHVSWNYTQSAIFSGIVSGGVADPGLVRPVIAGPDLLTGGSFGLESSLLAFILCTATGILLLVKARRRGHIVLPVWRRGNSPADSPA